MKSIRLVSGSLAILAFVVSCADPQVTLPASHGDAELILEQCDDAQPDPDCLGWLLGGTVLSECNRRISRKWYSSRGRYQSDTSVFHGDSSQRATVRVQRRAQFYRRAEWAARVHGAGGVRGRSQWLDQGIIEYASDREHQPSLIKATRGVRYLDSNSVQNRSRVFLSIALRYAALPR
jgi:hypothetical protein